MSDLGKTASKARADLEATFAAIEDKLNVPKRIGKLKAKATDSYNDNPQRWLTAGAAAVVVIGGTIVWSIIGSRGRR